MSTTVTSPRQLQRRRRRQRRRRQRLTIIFLVVICIICLIVMISIVSPPSPPLSLSSHHEKPHNQSTTTTTTTTTINNDSNNSSTSHTTTTPLLPWKKGYLDIHHLRVGSSQSTFVIMPDGTTILIDGGAPDLPFYEKKSDMKMRGPYPNDSKSPTGWILEYLREIHGVGTSSSSLYDLDYLLLTHFHPDHMGEPPHDDSHRHSSSNATDPPTPGLVEILSHLSVRRIIDRNYPSYDYPTDLRHASPAIQEYVNVVSQLVDRNRTMAEQFHVGRRDQIVMVRNETEDYDCDVLVLRSNLDVFVRENSNSSSDEDFNVGRIPGSSFTNTTTSPPSWDENQLSAALLLRYGTFHYYEGGDQDIRLGLDTVTPTVHAVGHAVDVATLDHHGHGVTKDFVSVMNPSQVILQSWCDDQPPTVAVERLAKGGGVEIFATDLFEERLEALGEDLAKLFVSTGGHVVVRVYPPPSSRLSSSASQMYHIYVLNGERMVTSVHGPYTVRDKG